MRLASRDVLGKTPSGKKLDKRGPAFFFAPQPFAPLIKNAALGGAFAPAQTIYQYAKGNAFKFIDRRGLDTYVVNRDLSVVASLLGTGARPQWDPLTHTFTVTTNPDGSVAHTYSWGNDANLQGWNLDQPLDIATAKQALQNGEALWVGGSDFDPYVGLAFNQISNTIFNHPNGLVSNNCKTETTNLLNTATYLQFSSPTVIGRTSPLITPVP